MPIYEYVCDSCQNELEVIQKISESHLTECPQCGKPSLKRKTSISAFHLKGGGWYKDGYSVPDSNGKNDKAESSAVKPAAETSTTNPKTESKSEPKSETSATKSADSKPSKTSTSSVPSSKAS